MKSFKQLLRENTFKHPYHVKPVSNRSDAAKEALQHSERRVHHLTMHERLWTLADKEKDPRKKEALHAASTLHRDAMSAHAHAEAHVLNDIHKKHPEQFSSPPKPPKKHASASEAKEAAHNASEAARVASAADKHSTYKGSHAAFIKSYPKI